MRRDRWKPGKNDRICEGHFLSSDYHCPPSLAGPLSTGKKYLKKDAVPSVFEFPSHFQPKSKKGRNPKKRDRPVVSERSSASLHKAAKIKKPNIESKNPIIDHSYASTISPRKVKANYQEKIKKKIKF